MVVVTGQPNVQDLINLENTRLQEIIDKYDDQRFKTRGWALTVAGGLFAFAANGNKPILAFAGAITSILFAYLEGLVIDTEVDVLVRSSELEDLIESTRRGGVDQAHNSYLFGVGRLFSGQRFAISRIVTLVAARPNVWVFYGGISLAMVAGALILILGS
jgi:hypothetical protein